MKAYAQRRCRTQEASPDLKGPSARSLASSRAARSPTHTRRTPVGRATVTTTRAEVEEPEAGLNADAPTRFGHDLSRIPLRPPAAHGLQMKLAVGEAGDAHEQEADRLADSVMRMPEPSLQRSCKCGGECPKCLTEESESKGRGVQLKRAAAAVAGGPSAPPVVHEALRSPGRPLDSTAANFFAERFGYDFGRVRVHTDAVAARSADAMGAHAYTVGRDLVFARGRYEPGTSGGRRLLAHELAHVIQQSGPEGAARGPLVQRAPCLSPAECGTKQGTAEETQTEVAQTEDAARQALKQRTVEQARTALHGSRAVEAGKLFAKELPDLTSTVHGVFIDEGAIHSHVGAGITDCKSWAEENLPKGTPTPQFEGAKQRCVFIRKEYEQEAREYNAGSEKPNGRDSREEWIVGFRRRFTHEATHERFVENSSRPNPGVRFPGSDENQDCALVFSGRVGGRANAPMGLAAEVSELAAEISEYTVFSRADDRAAGARLIRWIKEKLTPKGESITGTIRAIRCTCSCPNADEFIRGAFKLATASWTEAEKIEFHLKMREFGPDYGLYWPFELPPRVGTVGRHQFTIGAGANIKGSDRLLTAALTYRFVLGHLLTEHLPLTVGAQLVGSDEPKLDKIFASRPRLEGGVLVGLQYIPESRATEKRFGGLTGRVDVGLGVGEFLLKPAAPEGPGTVTSADYILQVSGGFQFYIRNLTDLRPASLELGYRPDARPEPYFLPLAAASGAAPELEQGGTETPRPRTYSRPLDERRMCYVDRRYKTRRGDEGRDGRRDRQPRAGGHTEGRQRAARAEPRLPYRERP
jgi:hypothetical protein